jgi:anti-sigma factor (TIGR02949 family)
MNCKKVLFRLHAYMDGEMPADHMREIEIHLRACRSCQKEVDRIRTVGDVLKRLCVPPLAAGFSARVMAEARRMAPPAKAKRSFSPLEWQPVQWFLDLSFSMRLAACAIILLACFSGMFMSKELSLPGNPRAVAAEAGYLEGFEWFSPAPPTSLSSAYLTLAFNTPQVQD